MQIPVAKPVHAQSTTVLPWLGRTSSLSNTLWTNTHDRSILQEFVGKRRRSNAFSYRTIIPYANAKAMGIKSDGKKIEVDANADLITKLKAAWRIFFPEKSKSLSPKEEGKKRLRMILVADRCGMTPDSLANMRESIVRAMEDFVEVEAEEAVEVNMSMDPEIGTIYSVAVPVKRVKPQMRPRMSEDPLPGLRVRRISETTTDESWDPLDPNSDPSDQFPYGT